MVNKTHLRASTLNAEVRVRIAQLGGNNIISTQGVITSSQELLIVDSCWEGNTDLVVFLKESTQDPIEVHMRNAYWESGMFMANA